MTVRSAAGRASRYVVGVGVLAFVAFVAGSVHFERTACGAADFDGECDLAGFAGIAWAVATIVAALAVIALVEVTRAVLRRRARARAEL